MGYSKALFDASVVCATSALRDPGAVWARTAVEDAKMGLGLLRDLRDLCPALDVSVLEALIRKLDSGGSGAGNGPKRKREGWDEGDGRDAVPVPGGSGAGGNDEESVPLTPVAVVSTQELKLRSPSRVGSNPSAAENASFMNNANKDNPEPRRTYPAIVIPSKFPPRKDRVKDRDLLKDGQRERGDKDKDRSKEKDKDRKKTSYPCVGFRVRPGKEPSPLARMRTTSGGTPTTTTTQGITGQSMPMSSQPNPVSDQSMPTSSQSMPSVVPLQPSSLASTPIDRSSYRSTPTSMSQEGGVDFSLPFGAAYEPQPQTTQKFTPYDYASSSASPFSYPDTPQYAQFSGPPSTPTSFAPPAQLPHYSGSAPQPQPSFPAQIQAPQFPASQAPYSEHPLPSQQQQQPTRFSFGPQYPETGLVREYYGSQEKQPAQRQGYQQEYSGEQQAVYGVKSSVDQHVTSQQGYAGGHQGYVEQTWTEGNEGQYWSSYPTQPQLRYQE
ncbi:hypothetical protein BDR04DRAFT_752435 [Suillus decipiens]|nr:hypothetical protein BDR04DRAFT_752435 [Suillus decipiens]